MTDVAKKVQDYKDSLKQKAEHLIIKGFPEKIVKLNELLETPHFQNRDLSDVHQDLNIPVPPPVPSNSEPSAKRQRLDSTDTSSSTIEGTKVYALPNGTVPCNKPLSDLIHLVKPHIRELVEDSNLLKMWISFMIPKIEDGNNFGVSIQEDTLAEIQSVESEAAAFFDQISRYFISRAKIVSKVAKYPHIEDYRRAVKVGDFGLAREYGSPLRQYTPVVVTLWYRAPELLLCVKEYSTPIDMWSVGCIFAEFVTMNPLFPGKSEVDQLNRIFKDLGTPSELVWPGYKDLPAVQKMTFAEHPAGGLRARVGPDLLSETGHQLLQAFLTYNPLRRMTADVALEHAYFKENPVAIEPAMFPTWPAKSEGNRRSTHSPRPPAGGAAYAQFARADAEEARAFKVTARSLNVAPGFSLKF